MMKNDVVNPTITRKNRIHLNIHRMGQKVTHLVFELSFLMTHYISCLPNI